MCSPKVHVIQSLTASALLYPAIGVNVIPFGLATVFIDLDHVIEYANDTRSLNILGFFPYSRFMGQNAGKNFLALNIFHTFEFYLFVFMLATIFPLFYYVLSGFLFHHMADQVFLIKIGKPFVRAFFVIEYFIRRRNSEYAISIKDILKKEKKDLVGIDNLEKWLIRWGIK
ncbi:MAG: hypothetical protein D8M57_00230 [Candidatus Scalindua sp. AMX11]|nr:MAG: hypothetical protein DWQ00_18755 [Candidatus Scalindua sp.]NOG84134.1 hypothetical protein [Planctomycetota bacterium]RZV98957.1 MAG: hypothetical protein EX341_00675 [Candidatus Scalindua sp. SCAELEC01]TDE66852.1 MAG: hypothetical protein D8M57_00230 [Candidatus Scalindua sp. AMX11]GJQ57651.1 MAG: hypothetical protein SCALA701_04520 [Candidatus Scalindua sp.]